VAAKALGDVILGEPTPSAQFAQAGSQVHG
jgi:hypothetical protein